MMQALSRGPAAPNLSGPNVFGPPVSGLVGFGYYAPLVADLCAEAGRPVAFAVDDTDGAEPDTFGTAYQLGNRRIPVLTPAQFAGRARRTPNLELYAGRLECEPDTPVGADPFVRSRDWVRQWAGGQLRHPISLLGRVPPVPCPGRYAVFGYPGAGNVLAQAFVAALMDDTPPAPSEWTYRAGMADHFFRTFAAAVRAAVASLAHAGPPAFEFYGQEFGRMTLFADFGGGRVGAAAGIPSLRHHGFREFVTHARPTDAAVGHFADAAAPVVIAARHPCETLLSFANKLGRPARAILDRPNFLPGAVLGMADWYGHALRNRDRLFVCRYEALADRDAGHLAALADHLGRPLAAGRADDLFDRLLNRNLPASVPTHFHRGGTGKWRAEFTRRHLGQVCAGLPGAVFTALGYDVPTADLRADEPPADSLPFAKPSVERPPSALDDLLLTESHYHRLPGPYDIFLTASDGELLAGLSAALADPDLLGLLAAAGFPTDSAHTRLAA